MVNATPASAAARRGAGPASPEGDGAAAAAASPIIRCGFCGTEFREDRGQPTCAACPLSTRVCRHIRCPQCGFENPATPDWVGRAPAALQRLKEWLRHDSD